MTFALLVLAAGALPPMLPGTVGAAEHAAIPKKMGPKAVAPAALPIGEGRVTGRLVGNPASGSLEGATVVLLWFRADAEGAPTGGPLGRQVAGKGGTYTFTGVPIDRKAKYQLGTRVDGTLVGSESFTFAPGALEASVDLKIPDVSTDGSTLRIGQAVYAFEPRLGEVEVTEVIHLENPGGAIIDVSTSPLEFAVPPGAYDLQLVRSDLDNGSHERLGPKLLVFGKIRPGINTVAFRYRLPAGLGVARLEKTYTMPIAEVLVLSPMGGLEVTGERLKRDGTRNFEQRSYSAWVAGQVPASTPFRMTVSGVPVRQALLLIPWAGFFAVMAGVVFWFFRKRLGGAKAA